jgi:2-polyprenyl-3-methyl-5-hydroxy-6-metoxy-1,4-benzoquinol methylase
MGLLRAMERLPFVRNGRLRWIAWRYHRDLADLHWLTGDCNGERGDFLIPLRSSSRQAVHLDRYRMACGLAAGKDVGDIACGTGYGSWLLRTEGLAGSVVGIDIDPRAIQYGQKYYAAEGIRRVATDALHTGLESESLDLVVSFETLEHLDDGNGLLAEFVRLLRPGGRLLISTPNDWGSTQHHLVSYDYAGFVALLRRHGAVPKTYAQYSEQGRRRHGLDQRIREYTGEFDQTHSTCFIALLEKA